MHIPAILQRKVTRCFGPEGEEWLKKLPHLFDQAVSKWHLTDCQASEVISFNYVCFAHSPQYGDVAVKIGVPHSELYTEMTALNLFRGRNICRCYEHDPDLGAMLLERIKPGYDLTTLTSSPDRIQAAAKLVGALPVPLSHDHGLPKWSALARKTFGKLRNENTAGEKMLSLVKIAEEMINQLENSGRPKVLLHGDLNHWNILMNSDGHWQAIDPKGQVGVACMEAGRFILNELEIAAQKNPAPLLNQMTEVFSRELKEPKHIIAQCAFLDIALGTSWTFEEHQKRDMTANVEGCQFLLDFFLRTKGNA